MKRRNILKNVVFNLILSDRERRKLPKLNEIVQEFNKKGKDKKEILQKINGLYGKRKEIITEPKLNINIKEDVKYEFLMSRFDRIN